MSTVSKRFIFIFSENVEQLQFWFEVWNNFNGIPVPLDFVKPAWQLQVFGSVQFPSPQPPSHLGTHISPSAWRMNPVLQEHSPLTVHTPFKHPFGHVGTQFPAKSRICAAWQTHLFGAVQLPFTQPFSQTGWHRWWLCGMRS